MRLAVLATADRDKKKKTRAHFCCAKTSVTFAKVRYKPIEYAQSARDSVEVDHGAHGRLFCLSHNQTADGEKKKGALGTHFFRSRPNGVAGFVCIGFFFEKEKGGQGRCDRGNVDGGLAQVPAVLPCASEVRKSRGREKSKTSVDRWAPAGRTRSMADTTIIRSERHQYCRHLKKGEQT